MSTIQKLKNKAGRLIEDRFLQTGTILEVRPWEASSMIEIDLHLPSADIAGWTAVPYIKIKVADLTYRDYTPSRWDAETSTCSLFIDARHNGPGSSWAKTLRKGDSISYLKIRSTEHSPSATSAIIALGDESSLGHLLALEQMTMPSGRFSAAILMDNEQQRKLLPEYFPLNIQAMPRKDQHGHHTLMNWLIDKYLTIDNTLFYVAGNNTFVDKLRKALQQYGCEKKQLFVQGFWS